MKKKEILSNMFVTRKDIELMVGELISSVTSTKIPKGQSLHTAYEKKDIGLFDYSLMFDADFNEKDANGYTVLHKSFQQCSTLSESLKYSKKKHLKDSLALEELFIQSILSAHVKHSNTTNSSDPNGITHFHIACASKNIKAVELFLRSGVSVNQAVVSGKFEGNIPLHFAVLSGHLNICEMLLKNGASINLKNSKGWTPLQMSVGKNIVLIDSTDSSCDENVDSNEAIINLLLLHDVDEDFSHLFVASAMKNSYATQILLAQGVSDVNQSISMNSNIWSGYTALHFASHVNVDTVKLLLRYGANIEAKAANGLTPFRMCSDRYKVEDIVDIINLVPAWKEILMSDGKTKLVDLLYAFKNLESIKNFLHQSKHNANLFVPHDSPLFPNFGVLHLAVKFSERIKCKFDYKTREDHTYFEPDLSIATEILYQGADITFLNKRHWSPVHQAFQLGKGRIVNLLLENYRQLKNCVDADNLSHLHIACLMCNRAAVEELLWKDIDVNTAYKGKSIPSLYSGWTPLHVAVFKGHCEIIKLLLGHGANLHARDADSFTPIHILINHKHPLTSELGKILFASPILEDCVIENMGLSYLHIACWTKNVDAVKKLLDLGVDVNKAVRYEELDNSDTSSKITTIASLNGCTPLHFSLENTCTSASRKSKNASIEIFKLLLNRGADILAKNAAGTIPLTTILNSINHLLYVDTIIDVIKNNHNLRRHIEEEFNFTLLHLACRQANFNLIKELLSNGFAVNVKVHDSVWSANTPLHLLIMSDRGRNARTDLETMIRFLLHRDADVTLINANGHTPIYYAYQYFLGHPDALNLNILNLMLNSQKNFDVNSKTSSGLSHFHIACHVLNVDVVRNFLEHEVDVNAAIDASFHHDMASFTPLLMAIKAISVDKANAKVELNESLEKLEIVNLLIKHGADVNVKAVLRNTPLHYAAMCSFHRENLLRLLVKNKAEVNAKNTRGETPLELLLRKNNFTMEEISIFVAKGCRVNAFNFKTGLGYIALASTLFPLDKIQHLIFGTFVNYPKLMKTDEKNRTVIHNLVSVKKSKLNATEYVDLFESCQKFGCDIDDQDNLGRTALHLASSFRNESAVEGLLIAGANVNLTDNNGRTAFDYVCQPCSRCNSADKNHNQYSHFKLFQLFAIQVRKLIIYELDVNVKNEVLVDMVVDKFQSQNILKDLGSIILLDTELMLLQIEPFELVLRDFVLGSFVLDYPTMSFAKRKAIDEFFKSNKSIFNTTYKNSVGIIQYRYREAVARRKIFNPALDSLSALMKFRLPDICSHMVLRFLKNTDLKNMILSTDQRNNVKKL